MKTNHLIRATLLAAATLAAIPACKDEETAATPEPQPAAETQPAPEPAKPAAPTEEEIATMIAGNLGGCAIATPGALIVDSSTANEDGSLSMTARLALTLNEDLFTRENAPASFNAERLAVNESLNRAMLPESVYLMQVGAPTEMLTEPDRSAKPLPENLQAAANELKELAEASVYRSKAPAGQPVEVTATFKAALTPENTWDFADVVLDNAALVAMEAGIARSTLPEGAPILTPEFEEARKAEIREKIAAFNEAAAPYIQGREEAARTRLAEHRARMEEELKAATEQAEADAFARREWAERCAKFLADGKQFTGEWTRANRFGELTLQITRARRLDNAIQFYGSIYDTKLPAASLDIEGRCDLSQGGDKAHVDITIYDGQYDPDQPTAEVYDANDSMMVLKLSADGVLEGVMSCQSWKETPDKAFNIHLSPAKEKESSGSRRRH